MSVGRLAHTATRLTDGHVIVIGGENANHEPTAAVDIFDPTAATWSKGPSLPAPRSNHVAVLLKSGKVLVAGGGRNTPIGQPLGGDGTLHDALLFDPATSAFTPTGDLNEPRSHFHAALTSSGQVLAIGGGGAAQEELDSCGSSPYCGPFAHALESVERYDEATGAWTKAAPMATGRNSFSATALATGEVLVTGGVDGKGKGFKSTELYDPAKDEWRAGPDLLGSYREHHTAARLGSGRVLVAGGKNPNVIPLDSAQVFDPAASGWTMAPKMSSKRTMPALVTLTSGHVLMVGGYDQRNQTNVDEAMLFDDETSAWRAIAPLETARVFHSATLLADGRVLVCGGTSGTALRTCEITVSATE